MNHPLFWFLFKRMNLSVYFLSLSLIISLFVQQTWELPFKWAEFNKDRSEYAKGLVAKLGKKAAIAIGALAVVGYTAGGLYYAGKGIGRRIKEGKNKTKTDDLKHSNNKTSSDLPPNNKDVVKD
jgi:hypothetical protein